MSLLEKGAFELAQMIHSGEVSSHEVVKAHIDRIEDINPKINAMVEHRFEKALEESLICDEALVQKKVDLEKRPLLGVPFSMKEMIHVENMKSTLGSLHRKNFRATEDATVTERLQAAGAICLGTTNVPEVGFWFECDNPVYGKTHNPYDLQRTAGGSSGGEAALIASGGSPFGIGSDIGGSIRIPAAFCGIFGHKPSEGVIPFTGHFPLSISTAKEMSPDEYPFTVLGPMARKGSDLYPLMKLLIGPDGYDLSCKPNFEMQNKLNDFESLKVYVLAEPLIHGASQTEPSIASAVERCAEYLKQFGAQIRPLEQKTFLKAFDLWKSRAKSIPGRHFPSYLSNGNAIDYKTEFFNLLRGRRKYTLPALLTAFLDELDSGNTDVPTLMNELDKLDRHLRNLLRNNAVILMPTHPRTAPRHNSTFSRPFDFVYTGVFNALGYPASVAPLGFDDQGLPLSVQIVALPQNDHLCLSVMESLEIAFGGWKLPSEPIDEILK
ncbi:MAG: amidase [Proteobacteria bacterium]|nr:amidase [Pseudomonadota bacterium]